MTAQHSDDRQPSWTKRVPDDLYIPAEQRRPLGIGALAGLAIGILIGWFVLGWWLFPVRYEGAYPNHLNPESMAKYVSAVADAYAARRDEAALNLAKYRLSAFIGEGILDETFQTAQDEILKLQSTMPDDPNLTRDVLNAPARIDNLALLEMTINPPVAEDSMSTESGAPATGGDAQQSAEVQPAPAQTQSADPPTDGNNGGRSFWQWLLIGFFSVLVVAQIGGGLYLLWRVTKNRNLDGEDVTVPAPLTDEPEAPAAQGYASRPHASTAGGRPAHLVVSTVDPQQEREYSFGEDPADGPDAVVSAPTAVIDLDDDDWDEDESWVDDMEAVEGQGDEPSSTPDLLSRPVTPRKAVVATNVAHFRADATDFDEHYTLVDPESQMDIGDCGVGITTPGGLRTNHHDDVIAFDVWLFDKLDSERIGNYKRVLVCEYVINRGLESSYTDSKGAVGAPIVAQPNLDFEISGANLRLLCRVVEVVYTVDGIFADLTLEMTVVKKG